MTEEGFFSDSHFTHCAMTERMSTVKVSLWATITLVVHQSTADEQISFVSGHRPAVLQSETLTANSEIFTDE